MQDRQKRGSGLRAAGLLLLIALLVGALPAAVAQTPEAGQPTPAKPFPADDNNPLDDLEQVAPPASTAAPAPPAQPQPTPPSMREQDMQPELDPDQADVPAFPEQAVPGRAVGRDGHPGGNGRLPCYAAERISNPPRFMSLPLPAHQRMEVLNGWQYTFNHHPQCGIDYALRNEGQALGGFPVLAVADGEACADWDHTGSGCVSGFGGRVLIKHVVEGRVYYTYYGHLITIDDSIPIGSRGNTVPVERGQVLGYAGNTGTGGGAIHLHFGVAAPWFGWYDPYDLWGLAVKYPNPQGSNGLLSGNNSFWTTNPPSSAAQTVQVGGAEAAAPADALISGSVDLASWTQIAGIDSGVVEVWINGQRRGEADYGPLPGAPDSSFSWRWDTTQERNGPHTVRLRAVSENPAGTPSFTLSDAQEASFLVTVQNPRGFVESLPPGSQVTGTVPVSGWVTSENSTITSVEVWINGEKQGEALYGLPSRSAGGAFGFAWNWDTVGFPDGSYDVAVQAVAANGGTMVLRSVHDVQSPTINVTTHNQAAIHRWRMR